jgi:hypothetical protein
MPSYKYLNKRVQIVGARMKKIKVKQYKKVNVLKNVDSTTYTNRFCDIGSFKIITNCSGITYKQYCKGKFIKPLVGYRKESSCLVNDISCPKMQEIYKDPHSKSMNKNVCYDKRIRAINHKNGKKDLNYCYDYASYLRKKCKSFKKNSNVFIIGNDNNGNNIYRSDCHNEKEVTKGTMQGDLQLAATESAVDNFYKGMIITITDGTGVGKSATIVKYTGNTTTAIVSPDIATDNTSQYVIKCCSYKVITSGTMKAAGELALTDSSKDNFYRNMLIDIDDGGVKSSHMITGYDGNTRVVTLLPALAAGKPAINSTYVISLRVCNLVSYKPKNKEFMTNGAVSSSSRLGRVKYDAITRGNCEKNGKCSTYSSFYRGGILTPVNGNARFPNNGFDCGNGAKGCAGSRTLNKGTTSEKKSTWATKRIRIGGVMRKAR